MVVRVYDRGAMLGEVDEDGGVVGRAHLGAGCAVDGAGLEAGGEIG